MHSHCMCFSLNLTQLFRCEIRLSRLHQHWLSFVKWSHAQRYPKAFQTRVTSGTNQAYCVSFFVHFFENDTINDKSSIAENVRVGRRGGLEHRKLMFIQDVVKMVRHITNMHKKVKSSDDGKLMWYEVHMNSGWMKNTVQPVGFAQLHLNRGSMGLNFNDANV